MVITRMFNGNLRRESPLRICLSLKIIFDKAPHRPLIHPISLILFWLIIIWINIIALGSLSFSLLNNFYVLRFLSNVVTSKCGAILISYNWGDALTWVAILKLIIWKKFFSSCVPCESISFIDFNRCLSAADWVNLGFYWTIFLGYILISFVKLDFVVAVNELLFLISVLFLKIFVNFFLKGSLWQVCWEYFI